MDDCRPDDVPSPVNFPFLEINLNRGLKIGHININRLYNKLDGIRSLLDHFRFDILAISETWLKSDVLDSEINIEGYSICSAFSDGPFAG